MMYTLGERLFVTHDIKNKFRQWFADKYRKDLEAQRRMMLPHHSFHAVPKITTSFDRGKIEFGCETLRFRVLDENCGILLLHMLHCSSRKPEQFKSIVQGLMKAAAPTFGVVMATTNSYQRRANAIFRSLGFEADKYKNPNSHNTIYVWRRRLKTITKHEMPELDFLWEGHRAERRRDRERERRWRQENEEFMRRYRQMLPAARPAA